MLIPLTLNKCNPTTVDAPAVIDTTVFAGKETSSPIQVRDRTPYISLVLIGGVFFDATTATTLQSQPVEYLTTIKDREDNAPSPVTLSPIPPCSEKTALPMLLPISPWPQTHSSPGASSASSGVLTSANPGRHHYSREALLTIWKHVKALSQYYAAAWIVINRGFETHEISATGFHRYRLGSVWPNPCHTLTCECGSCTCSGGYSLVSATSLHVCWPLSTLEQLLDYPPCHYA